MCLRRASGAALFLSVIFLQTGCVFTGDAALPAEAPGMDAHASRPKELPADRTAELCQAAAEEMEKQGLNSDAVAQYEKARRLDPKRGPVVARRLAVLYDRLGDDAHALADYKEALTAAPHDADLLNDFGYYHYQRGELDEAEKCFRQALEANHSHLRAAVNLGLTLGKQGKADASLEAFRQVLPASEAYCNVGVLLAQQGKAADARHSLEEALHLEPGMKQARLVLDHLDDIAAAAPAAGRPAVAAVAPPPPVRQVVAPAAPTPIARRETNIPLTPLPPIREVAAVPSAQPLRPALTSVALPPIQQTAGSVAQPAARQADFVPLAPPPPLLRQSDIASAPPPPVRHETLVPAAPPLLRQTATVPAAPPPVARRTTVVPAAPPPLRRETASAPIAPSPPVRVSITTVEPFPPHPQPVIQLPLPPLPSEEKPAAASPAVAPLPPAPSATIKSVQPEPD